ncbi:hypothetical protein ACFY1L_09585 [Streptomyces sp. NPDC001663]|uniref:hypothetical protein n=1 Tax=Streptomyces sp. NPDC001663 TaxID=3364597 RepID=UPI003682133C
MAAVAVGALVVLVGVEGCGVSSPSAGAELLAGVLGPGEAVPERCDDGSAATPAEAGAVDAVGLVRFSLPWMPSDGDPEDDPEKDSATAAATADTAPTAPAATTTRRDRHTLGFRRALRCGRTALTPPAPSATGGSCCVSSYALSHPCAEAGSVYSSYAGDDTPSGWYTFGGSTGPPPSGSKSLGVDMGANSRDLWDP